MRLLTKRLGVLALTATITLGGIPVYAGADDSFQDEWLDESAFTYTFDNTQAGYASGVITVTGMPETVDTVELYWADSKGAKLTRDGVLYSEFGSMSVSEGTGTYTISNKYTAIPVGATQVLVSDSKGNEAVYPLPDNKITKLPGKKYSFGVFSDIHYNRYIYDGVDCAVKAFDDTLKFLEKTAKVAFVTGTGDLSKSSEKSALEKYQTAVNKVNIPVYTCMGNHDVYSKAYWGTYVNKDIKAKNAKSKGILQVADNGIDFVYQNPAYKDEVYIFFSQDYWRGPGVNLPLIDMNKNNKINWLKEMLATYSNKTVYLYFHTYVSANNGDITQSVGNLLAPNGYTYDLTFPVGTDDDKTLKYLLRNNPNVTMFSGHSHWAYNTQDYNVNLNIGNLGTGATLVHVSSVGDPRDVLGTDNTLPTLFPEDSTNRVERAGLASEAMVVDVYNGYSVYNGVDTYNGEYLAYAVYVSPVGAKKTPESMAGPAKTKITKIKRANKYATKATITWAKKTGAESYEVQYATNAKFKSAKTKTVKKNTVTLKSLKAGKTYYVRVRSYKVKYGKKRYSNYSKVKKIVVKKKPIKKKK